jgi:LysR family transcriptional regulator, carnitine catabolism transcriptional activator
MKSINLSSRDLEAFLALAHARHFTRAAEACHLSQSAFSQKISRIEQIAGVALFARSTRQVILTPEGQVFAEEVRRIQQDLHHALGHLNDLATRQVGKVAVAALPSVAATWLPNVLADYRQAYPNIRLTLNDALADGGLSLLREGKVDLAITAGGDLREFDLTELTQERFYLVCKKNHDLATRRSVTLAQLADLPMVHLARSSSVRKRLELAGMSALSDSFEVEHLATVAALVLKGFGITVVPELTLFHFHHEGLIHLPVRDKSLFRRLVLARRKSEALSAAANAMHEAIISAGRGQVESLRKR